MSNDMQDIGFDESEGLGDAERIKIQFDDGDVVEAIVMAEVEIEGTTYVVLSPSDELEAQEGDLLITQIDPDGETLSAVQDEATIQKGAEALADILPVG